MRKTFIFFTAVFLFATPLIAGALTIHALGDPWFSVEEVDISSTLPTNIQIEYLKPSEYEKSEETAGTLRLRNKSNQPLFVEESLGGFDRGGAEKISPFEDCGGTRGPYKLLNNSIEECLESYTSSSGVSFRNESFSEQVGWKEVSLTKISNDIKDVWSLGDGRPESVSVPDSVNFTYNVIYAGEIEKISGTVDFALNQDYNPTARQDTLDEAHEDWPPEVQRESRVLRLLRNAYESVIDLFS